MEFDRQRDENTRSGEAAKLESRQLAVSTYELLHLFGDGQAYSSAYESACAVVEALSARKIPAGITPGGLDFSLNEGNLHAAREVLEEFNIDIDLLGKQTFHQQIVEAGGLQNLANAELFDQEENSGRARQIFSKIVGRRN